MPCGSAARRRKLAAARVLGRAGGGLGVAFAIGRQVVVALGETVRYRCARDQRHQLVEAAGVPPRILAGGQRIEPGDMGEQQPAVEAAARADQLAAVEDRFLHAVDGTAAEHLPGMIGRQHQRGRPAAREQRVAPPLDIGGLRRNPHRGAGGAHVAIRGKMAEERGLARRAPAVAAQGGAEGLGKGGGLIHGFAAP